MKRIVVIGAGGMAREVKSLISEINRGTPEWHFMGYVVSDLNALTDRDSRDEVLGDYCWLREHATEIDAVTIGIGTPAARLKVRNEIQQVLPKVEFPVLVHPTAYLDFETARIGQGALICAGVVGTLNIVLEPFALCNFGCTLGHEAVIGEGSVINPGANISGGVTIGGGVLVGTGAQVLQYRTVGDRVTVGAGAVVTHDVEPGTTVIGIPARPINKSETKVSGEVSTKYPYAPWPQFAPEEVEAAMRVLQSGKVNYWTGTEGREFEKEFAEFAGCKHAIALANGTVALETALKALGIGPGDEVITTTRTFIASASSVVAVGARLVVADVDCDSQNLSADTIKPMITPRTKAIIAVHLAGWPCEMDGIMELARHHGLKVVEDCAQAQGAIYKGKRVGSIGDAAAFSFCQDKIMTTGGEGGMLTANDTELWQRAWSYKDHGKSYDAVYNREHPIGFRWLHESFGTNGRMTEMQAAIGRVALKKVPGWIETRRRYAAILNGRLSQVRGLRIATPPSHSQHAYYKYYVFVRPEQLRAGWDRDRIMQAICAEGVPCSVGSCSEIYLEKAFAPERRQKRRLPVAKELGETSLMFLVHPTLTTESIEHACQVVEKVMAAASAPAVVLNTSLKAALSAANSL